jgi:hypothetical protein
MLYLYEPEKVTYPPSHVKILILTRKNFLIFAGSGSFKRLIFDKIVITKKEFFILLIRIKN